MKGLGLLDRRRREDRVPAGAQPEVRILRQAASRVIVVRATGTRAKVEACRRTRDGYVVAFRADGWVGRNGVAPRGAALNAAEIAELVEWALPIQERHFSEVKEGSLVLAAEEDPDS